VPPDGQAYRFSSRCYGDQEPPLTAFWCHE
jgi:hypothetical protein